MRTYHKVDYQGDGSLLGLFRINRNDDGHIVSYETFNRQTHRWVDDPSKSAYVFTGEVGATQISEAEAAILERQLSRGQRTSNRSRRAVSRQPRCAERHRIVRKRQPADSHVGGRPRPPGLCLQGGAGRDPDRRDGGRSPGAAAAEPVGAELG